MKGTGLKHRPLIIEWSPDRVRAFDPVTRTLTTGATLAECLPHPAPGREAIVGVSQRSAFIRGLYVPKVSRAEVAKILEFRLASLLPLAANEYVFGFRMGADAGEKGRLAVVAAIKTESLRRIYREAEAIGIRVTDVIPVAFGSWLAARERSIAECIVVEADGDAVSVDLIHGGELFYSRSIPMPPSPADLRNEVLRTCTIAEIPPSPIFSTGCPGIHADLTYDQEAFQYLADSHEIRRLLFSLELPEAVEAARSKADRGKAQRALVAAAAALVIGGYAVVRWLPTPVESKPVSAKSKSELQAARTKQASAKVKLADATTANKLLDVAFEPGQSLSDIVIVLSRLANQNSWFTTLAITRGAPVSVSGLALTDSDVAKFSAAISKDPRFQEMKVISSHKATVGKKQVTQFLVLGKLKGLLAFDRPPKKSKLPKEKPEPKQS